MERGARAAHRARSAGRARGIVRHDQRSLARDRPRVSGSPVDVAVVGGGLAGLATAFYLRRARPADPPRVVVLEQEPTLGGKLVTDRVDGFIIDGGADSFRADEGALDLCRDLGIGDTLVAASAACERVYIFAGGKLHLLPPGMAGAVPTDLGAFAGSRLLSIAGKLRLTRDLRLPAAPPVEDESIAAFIRRRLGQEAVDKLAQPIMAAPYAGDPTWLSMQATYPEYVAAERAHGSLIRGMRAPVARRAERVSPAAGMGAIVEALIGAIGPENLRAGAGVAHITRGSEAQAPYRLRLKDGETVPARRIVIATPASAAAVLLTDVAPTLAAELSQIRYVSSVAVALGYRAADVGRAFDGCGWQAAAGERTPLLSCAWISNAFPDHAPAGHVLLRGLVSGATGAAVVDLFDAEITALVRAELGAILGLQAAPVVSRLYRWRGGNPQYGVGHLARVQRMESLAATQAPGVYLTGSALYGVGVAEVIAAARGVAERALAAPAA
jgi:protoporphyrinogen/coproporphyrinogen III oxidase